MCSVCDTIATAESEDVRSAVYMYVWYTCLSFHQQWGRVLSHISLVYAAAASEIYVKNCITSMTLYAGDALVKAAGEATARYIWPPCHPMLTTTLS